MMKIIITIQIIIINIYINLLFTTDSLKKVILIGESYSRFFKPNTGSMQCLINVAESQVHHKWAVSHSIPELSEWMLCYLPQQPRHSKIYASRIIFSTLASLSYWMCTSRNNGMMSSKKIFIAIKARADAEHMESLLLFDSLKEVTTCNLLKNISGTWNNDKPKGMPRTISRLVVVAPSSKTQSSSTLLMLRSLRHLPWVDMHHQHAVI